MFSLEVDPAYVCDKWEPITEANMADSAVEQRRDFSQAEREKLAKSGAAMPDGSFPIVTTEDLRNAIAAVGRASNKAAAKAHIVKRAKALGATDLLPEDWRSADEDLEDRADDDGDEDVCPGCGAEMDGETCPECGETKSVGGQEENAASPELESRKARAELLDGTTQRRNFDADMELRSTTDDGVLHLTGYASTTETPYEVSDFTETIARGAFKRTLGENPDVVLLVNHDGIPLARTKSGTLTLSEDARGLRVDADLDASNPLVQSLVSPMQRGDLTEMSFAFRATQQDWDEDYTTRTIREVSIHRGDVSMVTHGANSATAGSVSIRSEGSDEEKPEKQEPPKVIRSYLQEARARKARLGRPR